MYRLLDFPGLQTTCTHFHPPNLPVWKPNPYLLDIGIPPPARPFIGVAYFMPGMRFFAADLTNLGHHFTPKA